MGLDVVAYTAFQRARVAGTGVVHLHPSQLAEEVVERLRGGGVEVHAWDVNTTAAFRLAARLGLAWVTTDQLEQALAWRAAAEATE
jgi:glycerophosphoryl diester phosphodiesterase